MPVGVRFHPDPKLLIYIKMLYAGGGGTPPLHILLIILLYMLKFT